MRTMKDSGIPWIGQIPEDWALDRLKYHATLNPAVDLTVKGFEEEDEVSFIPMENLKSGYHKLSQVAYGKVRRGYTIFENGDILIAKVTPCFENGNLAIAQDLCRGVGFGSTEISVVRCSVSMNSKYLFYLFQNPKFIEKGVSEMYGVAGLKRLPSSFLIESKYPFPPTGVQFAIAQYLDDKCGQIDSVIAAKEKTNEALKAYRQSVIYEAVTKGLDPAAPLKDTNIPWIGKIPCSWNVSRLKYLLRSERGAIKAGPFGSSLQAQDMRGSDVKVYNQRTVLDNDFTSGDDYVSFEKYRELLGFRVDSGDLLVTTRGTIGKTAIVPMNFQPGILHPCLIKLKLNEQVVNLKLLSLVFNSTNILLEQLRLASNATTIDVIYTHNLLDILFPLAPAHQQTEILKYLNDKCGQIDAVLAANEAIVKKLREYRQSLIYEAVTGKIACD